MPLDEPATLGRLIGAGRVADVHSFGTDVVKLYRSPEAKADALREAASMGLAEAHGLPVPAVRAVRMFDTRWGIVMSRAAGEPLAGQAELGPEGISGALDEMVRLHLAIHVRAEPRLPGLKTRLAARIAMASELIQARREALVAGLNALPDGDRICHGDFHPFNIIGAPGAGVIVDWLDATCGPPAADACRSYVLMASNVPEIAEGYLTRYGAASGLGRQAILRWLPYVAAARLAEGTDDTSFLLSVLDAAP